MSLRDLFSKKDIPAVETKATSSILSHKQSGGKGLANTSMEWLDIQDASTEELVKATAGYQLHAAHINQSLHKAQVEQISIEDEYIFLLLQLPYIERNDTESGKVEHIEGIDRIDLGKADENRIAVSQVSVFLGKNFLVTVHSSYSSGNSQIRDLFKTYAGSHNGEPETPGRVLQAIIELLLQDAAVLVQLMMNELDSIEANVFDDRNSDAYKIGKIRQNIMRLRRILASQRSVLDELDGAIDHFTGEQLYRYYRINSNTSRKLWETVEEARETIEIYKDADFTTSTERTNQILAVLTLLFTLTIPATTIGAFYGMNILLPGGIEAGSWTFLGQYTMLKLITAVSVLAAAFMYAYFKDKKWF